jgi:hypothetical protein
MAFDFTDPRLFAPRAALYALAFEEAGRALTLQQETIAGLRSRAANLLATAAVTTSILGGPLAASGGLTMAAIVATAAFVGVGICSLGLLWPYSLIMVDDVRSILADYAEPVHVPSPLVHRDLAILRAKSAERNRQVLDRMTLMLRVALCLLATEVVAWVVNVTQTA